MWVLSFSTASSRVRFGLPPGEGAIQAFSHHNNWVISITSRQRSGCRCFVLRRVATPIGHEQQNNIVHVGDRIMLVKLPSAFNPRGPDVVSRVTLNRDTSSLVGRELLCIGRGIRSTILRKSPEKRRGQQVIVEPISK